MIVEQGPQRRESNFDPETGQIDRVGRWKSRIDVAEED